MGGQPKGRGGEYPNNIQPKKDTSKADEYSKIYSAAKAQMGGAHPYVPATTDTYVNTPATSSPPPSGAPSYNNGSRGTGINPMQAAFDAQKEASKTEITGIQASNKSAYDEAVKKLSEHYATAEKDRGSSYVDARNNIGTNLQNLGINFADTDLAKEWDADQRILTETADTALATDLAWFEKIKSLDSSLYDAMLAELAKAQLAVGGSGGGGGGSSSSGDVAVTEDGVMYNPALASALQGMDPMYQLAYDAAGHNPTDAVSAAAKAQLEAMARPITPIRKFTASSNPMTLVSNILKTATSVPKNVVQTASRNQTVKKNQALGDFFNQYSPGRSPQVSKVTTKVKGKS